MLNVAAGKAPMQSSVAEGGIPQKAVDGSTSTFFDLSTCSLTEVEKSPWWYVNLLEPYMVQLVRIDFGQSCCGKSRQGWNGSFGRRVSSQGREKETRKKKFSSKWQIWGEGDIL